MSATFPKFRAALLALIVTGGATTALAPPALSQPDSGTFLQRLHSDLQLSPSQEGAWNSYQQSLRVDPQDYARQRDAQARMPGLNGPARMDLAISMAEQNLAGMRSRGDALKAFYATLSPEQQKVFDRDTMAPGGY
jgi:hypothetical protein